MSYEYLKNVQASDCFTFCNMGCDCATHRAAIDSLYERIVCALQYAELLAVPRVPLKSLKPLWNEYLDDLKDKSIFWEKLWNDAGKPKSGQLFRIKCSCSLKYKNAIKQATDEYEYRFDDALFEHYIHKEPVEFWKCWSSKFKRSFNRLSNQSRPINGVTGDAAVGNEFAKYLSSVYTDSDSNEVAKEEFMQALNTENTNASFKMNIELINVELIDKFLRRLKLGKSSGPDGLCAESLLNAHPSINYCRLCFIS